ncbi:aminotransferase class V-fold PLP-dependent enzyme [Nocardia amamiensis]|uniref:Aminotransferase class V-fold PLP-dependent enzyme n=1 Tax=Nocardia amamiensis TaxID=404578 RepID=A0ABS0D6Q9_9NOCA|nr:aminotransferase class V-fold PLP-dependent enzyme [Nocardia amamiensis]MBF6302849.1 aminotransferase class V-fold PLP-dependent enzyme [Nocardia amamiensis]
MPGTSEEFLAAYPEYAITARLDELRATEYCYLDSNEHVYLDYAGTGLAALAQYRAHTARLSEACFGNPHSENPASQASTELVECARRSVLAYFNAPPAEYTAIFTANATAACRLVGEAYAFGPAKRYVLTSDNHNSLNGIREFARARHAPTRYIPITGAELRISEQDVRSALQPRMRIGVRTSAKRHVRRGLFAYPAQSNFTGVQHPLEWVDLAHDYGYDVLLDAAAFVPTNALDLSAVKADFVPVSWYKLFGYPTGAGCLITRREALARLRRPWFSGGTIHAVSVQGDWYSPADGAAAFEDGTQNFLSIPDIDYGINWLRGIGIDLINLRTRCLTGWLLDRLPTLRHDNGAPLAEIYGPHHTGGRGATVAFNVLDPFGCVVDERLIARESAAAGLSLRTGCFCNPGAGEAAFEIGRPALLRLFGKQITIDDYLKALGLPTGGAVRVSLGLASNIRDVQRFIDFIDETYRNRPATVDGLPPRERC